MEDAVIQYVDFVIKKLYKLFKYFKIKIFKNFNLKNYLFSILY
jgi:hypothetical protein